MLSFLGQRGGAEPRGILGRTAGTRLVLDRWDELVRWGSSGDRDLSDLLRNQVVNVRSWIPIQVLCDLSPEHDSHSRLSELR